MTRKFGIVIEVEDRNLVGSTIPFPYPDKSVPRLDANNNVIGHEPKMGTLTFNGEGRTEVSEAVWHNLQAVMALVPQYPRLRRVGETVDPETQHVGWDQPAVARPVYSLNGGGLLVPEGVQGLPPSPYLPPS